MSADRRKLISAIAKTGLATLFTGPVGGLREAGGQAIALLSETSQKVSAQTILDGLSRDLDQFARAERMPDAEIEQALIATDGVLATTGATVAECADLDFDPERVARRVLGRAAARLNDLDEGARELCRSLVRHVYLRLLADPAALPELDRAFQREVLLRLGQLDRLPAETVTAIRRTAAAALVVDPRRSWRGDVFPETSLVRAEFGIVPFHGREDLLDEFNTWCRQQPQTALRLYVGAGGMGKTRLMIEACSRLRAAGWRTGFLAGGRDDTAPLDMIFDGETPMLIVVDYAEVRRPQLRALIGHALSRSVAPNVRLVALARSQGDWWQDLSSERGGVGDFVLGPAASTHALRPLAASLEERGEILRSAAMAFAAKLARPAVALPEPDVSGEHYERVLFLHLAALAAVLGQAVDTDRGLLDFALLRERAFWDAGVEAAGLEQLRGRPVAQAAAVATLAGRIDARAEAIRTLAKAPALGGQPEAAVAAVAELLHTLYPGDGWLEGVQPDLLGEHAILRAVQEDPSLLGVFDGGG